MRALREMMMRNALLGFGLVFGVACGGGGDGEDGEENAATTAGGETIRSATGQAVNVEAHNHWTEALELYSTASEAGWNEENCSRTLSKFEEAVEAQGNFAEALYMAGHVNEECGNAEEARDYYQRALQSAEAARRQAGDNRGPGNGPLCKARVALGLMDLEAGRRQPARAAFQRAVREDPQCTSGYTNLAILQREQGGAQEQEALRNLRRALAIESDYLPAFNQMALLYYKRGLEAGGGASLDLAEVVCRQAQLIDRNYAPIYNTWGLVKIEKGDVIEALRFFERAIQLDDSMFEAQMNFGQVTISFRGYQDAKRSFERAVELQPNSYEAHLGLGAALRGLEQFDAAKAEYERARELDGNRPEAYFNLGVLYQDYLGGNSMDETIANLNRAKEYYQQFLSKAQGEDYEEKRTLVERRCRPLSERRRRRSNRQWAGNCRPGRMQVIDLTIEALREAQQMHAEAEAMQREAEAQQRAMEQQQAQEGGGEGAEGGEGEGGE
ncbi:MAG TPA: tetratricopeptide repeat protein [Polyangiaceae bacterium LLY-WYZ-15_(1-7)]|nr:tetratricopeptide repeat protein [Polyangiaceae bacterium LLY-WYZ-15_(1-7)]